MPAYIGISSYREPFHLMYDLANAIDKTDAFVIDALWRSRVLFFLRHTVIDEDYFAGAAAASPQPKKKLRVSFLFFVFFCVFAIAINDDLLSTSLSATELTIPFVDEVNLSLSLRNSKENSTPILIAVRA